MDPGSSLSAEIWGQDSGKELEIIHTKCLRKILCVNKSTNLSALYGELGRYPLSVMRKLHIFKYWFKIISCTNDTNDSLIKITYNDANQNFQHGIVTNSCCLIAIGKTHEQQKKLLLPCVVINVSLLIERNYIK